MWRFTNRAPTRRAVIAVMMVAALFAANWLLAPASPAQASPTTNGKMMLVLDSSGSMDEAAEGGTKMAVAQQAMSSVVEALPSDADVGLRVFGAKVADEDDKNACTDSQLLVGIGRGNRAQLLGAIAAAKPFGQTPIAYALRQAAKDLGSDGTRSIVLVSDGIATCEPNPCDVAAELTASGVSLTVDVVGLGVDGSARNQLKCVAEKGKGKYYDADSADQISSAIETAATRTVKPLKFTGTEVKGTQDATGAPTLTAGDYVDLLGPRGDDTSVRYYAIDRTQDQSDIVVSALVSPRLGYAENLKITLTQSENQCSYDTEAVSASSWHSLISVSAIAGQERGYYAECRTAKRLVAKVERLDNGTSTADKQALPLQIRVTERPSVSNYWDLPDDLEVKATDDLVAGTPVPATPGSSLSDAAKLPSGATYEGDITAGEVQTFRVSVNWGEQLRAKLIVHEAAPSVKKTLETSNNSAIITIASPAGVVANSSYVANIADGGDTETASAVTMYRGMRDSQIMAGDYVVAVGLPVDSTAKNLLVPYEIIVQTDGATKGQPEYGSPQPSPAPSTSATTPVTSTETASAQPESGSGGPSLAQIALGTLAVLLVGGGTTLLVWRLRRRSVIPPASSPYGPGSPPPGPGPNGGQPPNGPSTPTG